MSWPIVVLSGSLGLLLLCSSCVEVTQIHFIALDAQGRPLARILDVAAAPAATRSSLRGGATPSPRWGKRPIDLDEIEIMVLAEKPGGSGCSLKSLVAAK